MLNTKFAATIVGLSLIAAPLPAAAQFGGLAKKAMGVATGTDGDAAATNPDEFLSGALLSTKNVMISAALLAQALNNRDELASQKLTIASVQNSTNFSELNAQKNALEKDLQILSERENLADDLTATYQAGNSAQKKIIALAISNLALGAYRNVKLASDAPKVIRSVGRDPQLLSRVGEFRAAGGMLGIQATSFGKIGGALPKVMGALKIPEPNKAGTDREMDVSSLL